MFVPSKAKYTQKTGSVKRKNVKTLNIFLGFILGVMNAEDSRWGPIPVKNGAGILFGLRSRVLLYELERPITSC
jgi:hypothetical protein